MPRLMFPYRTKDRWSDTPEPQEQVRLAQLALSESERRNRRHNPRGFFRQGEFLTPRERELRAQSAENWLTTVLYYGPVPAREIQRRIKADGQSKWGVWRAKKRLKVISVKVGGTWQGEGRALVVAIPLGVVTTRFARVKYGPHLLSEVFRNFITYYGSERYGKPLEPCLPLSRTPAVNKKRHFKVKL